MMDPLQISRRKVFFDGYKLDKKIKGIEIGPFTRPTVFANEAEIYYADYYNTNELREQAAQLNINQELVPEVSFTLKSNELHHQVSEDDYDFIIANHVLEHVIDPFRWLKNLEFSLKPNGRFLITLPDKRLSFDKFRPDTSLAHFIEDFLEGGEKTLGHHAVEAAIFYDYGYTGGVNNARERLHPDFLVSARESYHPGMHVHVFQANTFLNSILLPFLSIGWLNLKLEAFEFNIELGEFYISLVKTPFPQTKPPFDFYTKAYDTLEIKPVKYTS